MRYLLLIVLLSASLFAQRVFFQEKCKRGVLYYVLEGEYMDSGLGITPAVKPDGKPFQCKYITTQQKVKGVFGSKIERVTTLKVW